MAIPLSPPHASTILAEFAELLMDPHETVPTFLKAVLAKTTRFIPSDLACVAVSEEIDDQRWIIVRDSADYIIGAESGDWERYIGRLRVGGEELPEAERSFMGFVAHTAETRQSGNVKTERCYRASNRDVMSELASPILFRGQVLAVLNLESKREDCFSERDQSVLEFISALVAPSLHSLMIDEGLRRPAIDVLERLARLLDSVPVGIPLAASGVMPGIARTIASALKSLLCQVYMLRRDLELELVGEAACAAVCAPELSSHAYALAHNAFQRKCLVSEGMKYGPENEGQTEHEKPTNYGCPSGCRFAPPIIATPMLVFGKPVGAIVVGCRHVDGGDPRQTYTGSDIHLLNAIQGQLAAFVEVKRVEQARREHSDERSRQASRISAIFVEPDLDTVLKKTVLRVPELCKARFCSVFLWNPDEKAFILAASKGLASDWIGVASYAPGEGLTGWVGKHGRSLVLDSRAPADLAKISPDLVWESKYNEADSGSKSPMHPFAAVPIFKNGTTIGVLRLSDREEGSFNEGDEFLLTLVAAKIATAIEYGEDYKERIRLLRCLQVLTTCARNVHHERSEPFLREAARQDLLAFEADSVIIYRLTREGFQTPPVWVGKLRDESVMTSTMSPSDVPVIVFRNGASCYWPDARSEGILMAEVQRADGGPRRLRFVDREGISSSAAVLLRVGTDVVGVMFLNYLKHQAFAPERRELIETFGAQLALALETARLYDDIKDSASREEANQLATELHDVVTLLSHAVVDQIETISKRLETGAVGDVVGEIRSIGKRAADCAAELRGIMGELRKVDDPPQGVSDAIKTYIEAIKPRHLLITIGDIPEKVEALGGRLRRVLVMIARELIGNAISHAEAKHVNLLVLSATDRIMLRVQDDGHGFVQDLAFEKAGSLGLKGIRFRLARVGGSLDINSEPGFGSTITVTLPFE